MTGITFNNEGGFPAFYPTAKLVAIPNTNPVKFQNLILHEKSGEELQEAEQALVSEIETELGDGIIRILTVSEKPEDLGNVLRNVVSGKSVYMPRSTWNNTEFVVKVFDSQTK